MDHSAALTNMADSQSQLMHSKRNGRYDDDYPTYQEQKKPMTGYPTKSLTQRRPLSARSYSSETYGASQVDSLSADVSYPSATLQLNSQHFCELKYELNKCLQPCRSTVRAGGKSARKDIEGYTVYLTV